MKDSPGLDDIERLRREGPAYTGDEGWEVLPAGPFDVVLSVRFDSVAARRISALARATERTPSGLIRDWTLERLESLPSSQLSRSPAHALGEEPETYVAGNEGLRTEYRPEWIRWLFVGESSPASGRFFYRANSNLFRATRDAFVLAFGSMPPGEGFLKEFKNHGAWLVDLADRPVNRQRGRPRADAVDAGVGKLTTLIAEAQPELVVAVKATLEGPVRRASAAAGLSPERVHALQFPVRQWRFAYVRDLSVILSNAGTRPPAADLGASLHDAIREVVSRAEAAMPGRAVANEINRRALHVRDDGRSVDYQHVLASARKHPELFDVRRDGIRLIADRLQSE